MSQLSDIEDEIVLQLLNEEYNNIQQFQTVIENYTDEQFRRHFRLSRNTLELIIDKYVSKYGNCVLWNISPKIRVYMFVWYIANMETFRQLADRFGVSRSHAYDIVVEIAIFMANESKRLVKWPSLDDQKRISAGFKATSSVDNIIGAIDCTHLEIPRPKNNQEDYFNRKKYHSLQMQATVDHRKRFTSVFVGEPGSMHDARVLRRSRLFKNICEKPQEMVLPKGFLLGDLAYPKTYTWLVPPFKFSERMTHQKKQFNKLHSTSRIIVEQAFGLLKSRFRRLQKFGNIKKKLIILLTLSACGLHNLCIENDDRAIEHDTRISQSVFSSHRIEESTADQAITRQQQLLLELLEKNVIRR